MLKKPVDDADGAYVVTHTLSPGSHGEHPPDYKLYFNACISRLVKFGDDLSVSKVIDLYPYPGFLPGFCIFDFVIYEADKLIPESKRRDQQMVKLILPVVGAEEVECLEHLVGDLLVGCQQ